MEGTDYVTYLCHANSFRTHSCFSRTVFARDLSPDCHSLCQFGNRYAHCLGEIMGTVGTKHIGASIPEEVQPASWDNVDGPLIDSGAYNLRDLTYKVQRLTLLVAGGALPISSKQKFWQDITDLSDALNRLRALYPEELRAKSKSLLSLSESQVFTADRKPCLPRKISVSVQCDEEIFGNGIQSDSDGSVNSIRASSDSLVGDVAVSSSDRKSDIKYICSECNGTIRVFDNDAFSLSLKLHYEGAAHSQDSGQRSDKEDCRTTSSSSSDSTSCSPSEVSVTPGEPVDDCFNVFSAAETKAAVNVCIVKPSHSENSVRLTRCDVNSGGTPRHVTMWNSVRCRLVELGHVDYIVHHPGLKDFRCSLCKTGITGVQNIMQHVLGHTHTKLHLEEQGSTSLSKDASGRINVSSLDVSSINDKEGKYEQASKTKEFQLNQNSATLKKHSSAHELRVMQPFSDQVMNITPTLNTDGSVNYVAWQSMAQELREQGLDACIQQFHCSACNIQLTGMQKFIEHVHSYGHKDKQKQQHQPAAGKVASGSNAGLKPSSSIEEISTLQFKCSPCNLTLTEKDVLAHLAGKKHAVKDSYYRSSLKDNVENNGSLCKSRYDSSKRSQKVVNDNTFREQNVNFLKEDNSPLTLNPYVRSGVEAIQKCDQAAQTISVSNNVVNSSEKSLGVASKKMLEVEKKYYSKKEMAVKTGYNLYRYSSRQYRKDDMLQSSLPCNYEALKRSASYWCAVCNVMVDDSQKYFHIHQDVKLPCVPQQQVFGSAQYLIMNHSQNWGQ